MVVCGTHRTRRMSKVGFKMAVGCRRIAQPVTESDNCNEGPNDHLAHRSEHLIHRPLFGISVKVRQERNRRRLLGQLKNAAKFSAGVDIRKHQSSR